MRVADAISDWLASKNITHAFGIVGGGNAILFDAIQKAGKITLVCCHHEQAAAMASGYFNRVRGNLESVVLCTTGAGSTNAITGVMAAWMDSIPLLVLSGNEAWNYMGAKTRVWGTQGYGSSELAAPFTKYSARLDGRMDLGNLDFVYMTAISGRQGPCWIDIPKSAANETI